MRPIAAALIASLALAGAAMAGTVDVSYANPENYADAGTSSADERANVETLARHVQQLGQRLLPAGHTLKVEILDVDLAGTVRPTRRGDVRTVRGGADYPTMHVRYSLAAPGRAVRTGEDHISDMHYTRNAATHRVSSEHLHYEKRMLDAWFRQRFALAQ